MRILISTSSKGGLEDLVSPVFARAPTFTLVEIQDKEIKSVEVIPNNYASGFRGVGIQVAQFVANKGVDVVITGNVGPNASMVLNQAGVKIVTGFLNVKVKDAIQSYLGGTEIQKGFQPFKPPTLPPTLPTLEKTTEKDLEFEKRMLELQKKMLEEQIKYLEGKIKELKER